MAMPKRWQRAAVGVTLAVMAATSLAYVPREYADYAGTALDRFDQYPTYGADTIGGMYAAKVVLNDPADTYTKARLEQTAIEAATWSKEASAPYPPATLLAGAALFWIGERTGIGYYGMVVFVAGVFLLMSAHYFLRTRWYLFPLLYLNFTYWGFRFVYVQDWSYLLLLLVVMVALLLARRHPTAGHLVMAVAIAIKLLPVAFIKEVARMHRAAAAGFVVIIAAGLLLPLAIWDGYLGIYTFVTTDKGDWAAAAGALLVVIPTTLCVWYVQARLDFDLEDRIGWSLVPFAMLVAFRQNAARHLLIALLVPDKRGGRNLAGGLALGLHYLLPGVVRLNATLPIATALILLVLWRYLNRIGWAVVRDDLRHPGRTIQMLWTR
jgi:hypothetical protein